MSSDIEKIISEMGGTNLINKYMMDYVNKVCAKGMDDEMCREAVDDAIKASAMGVATDADFQTFFYIDHFVELEAGEITGTMSDADKEQLKSFMFSKRHDVDYSNLNTYRAIVLKWLDSKRMNKAAYHNKGAEPFVYDRYNLDKWKQLALEINKLLAIGRTRDEALVTMAKSLKLQEQEDFKAWYGFNFGDNRRLYNINDKIRDMSRSAKVNDSKLIKVASIFEDGTGYWAVELPKPKPEIISDKSSGPSVADTIVRDQKAADVNTVKTKMINRTFAIDKLLEKYRNVLSDEQIDQIEDALNVLRKKIRKLKLANTINDTMIKTASVLRNNKFDEGAEVLLKLAAPPTDAVVEKTDNKPDKPSASKSERSIDDLKKEDLRPILDKLYDVSVRLKRRNIVREIADIDLDLYNLNVASFFPELTDAQAKLIEAFGYASNKIEDVIPKLRSVSTGLPAEYDVSGDIAQEMGKAAPTPTEKPPAKPVATTAPAPVPAVKPQGK
jgi:hypothetical protein